MKKIVIAAFVSFVMLPAFAAQDSQKEQEYMELCQSYAKEEGVAAEELDDYLASCVQDFKESAEDK